MALLLTDLDNTLIYSHRRDAGEKKHPVEYLDGRQQSFMTDYSYRFFKEATWIDIVPVTLRTNAQFQRLTFMEDLRIKKAIICNGGILLENGRENARWSMETLRLTKESSCVLNDIVDVLIRDEQKVTIHRPVPYMVYFKSKNPAEESNRLKKWVNTNIINVEHDQRKVYMFVSNVNKGMAAVRYMRNTAAEIDVAAGDDVVDIPMLEHAKFAFASRKIAPLVKNKNLFVFDGELISDSICNELQRLHGLGEI